MANNTDKTAKYTVGQWLYVARALEGSYLVEGDMVMVYRVFPEDSMNHTMYGVLSPRGRKQYYPEVSLVEHWG